MLCNFAFSYRLYIVTSRILILNLATFVYYRLIRLLHHHRYPRNLGLCLRQLGLDILALFVLLSDFSELRHLMLVSLSKVTVILLEVQQLLFECLCLGH